MEASSLTCLVVDLAVGWNRRAHTWPLHMANASLHGVLNIAGILTCQFRALKVSVPESQTEAIYFAYFLPTSEVYKVPFTAFSWLQTSHRPTQILGRGQRPHFLVGDLSRSHCRKVCGWEILLLPSLKNTICYNILYAITHKYCICSQAFDKN